jgi:hypothetical protein
LNTLSVAETNHSRLKSFIGFFWGFFVLMPFPKVPFVGNTSDFQVTDSMSLIFIILVFIRSIQLPRRHAMIWLALIIPAFISLFSIVFGVPRDALLTFRVMAFWLVCTFQVIIAGYVFPREWRATVLGIALALIVQSYGAIIQIFSFNVNEFPMRWMYGRYYNDISAKIYATYTKRPFGFFQEPSAMAAAVGPWVLLLSAWLAGLIGHENLFSRSQKAMIILAVISGIFLIYISLTRYMIFFFIGLLVISLMWLFNNPRSIAVTVLRFLVVVIIGSALFFTLQTSLESRFANANGVRSASISDSRAASIIEGLKYWSNRSSSDFIFGVGMGQSAIMMQTKEGWGAIWSILFAYIVETGIAGILMWFGLLLVVFLRVMRSNSRTIGIIFFALWLVGIALSTTYFDLGSIWVALGFIFLWPEMTEVQRYQEE